MVSTTDDYRSALSGGIWVSAVAAAATLLYGLTTGSTLHFALGLEFALVAISATSARYAYLSRIFRSALPPSTSIDRSTATTSTSNDHRALSQLTTPIVACGTTLVGLVSLFQILQLTAVDPVTLNESAVSGMIGLISGLLWLVVGRLFQAIPREVLPEAPSLTSLYREAQWATWAASVALIGSSISAAWIDWVTAAILIWISVCCAESVIRLVIPILIPVETYAAGVAPIRCVTREIVFIAANPAVSFFQVFESLLGINLRTSWAISFIKASTLPLILLLLLLAWGMTSLVVVETHQMAFREHFGRIVGEPLLPGLHGTLPWPFGRVRAFTVKTIQQIPIGYVADDLPLNRDEPRALLWTKPHAKEEFGLVLGNGTELVAVNAVVYFKISEDPRQFADYVYRQSSAEEALTDFAYRALMEETRSRTLEEILSADRAAFGRRVAESLRIQSQQAHLGLEVVDFAVLNLHPPIEASGSYLDIINARLDARRGVIEADGNRDVSLLKAQTQSGVAISTSQVEASRRISMAMGETSEFKALATTTSIRSPTFRYRLWIEALESVLADQRIFLVDQTLLNQKGELILDTRTGAPQALRPVDSTPLPPASGPN